MIKKIPGEVWKSLSFKGSKDLRNHYAISSQGRIASFKEDVVKDGKLLNGSLTTGYRTLNLHRPGHKGTLYIHRELAKLFLTRNTPKHKYVIHKNHNKLDNSIKNLKWATVEEMIEHQQSSPAKIAYKKKQATREVGLKLTSAKVKKIKDLLNNKNRRMTIKQLADKYDVSEMTMYRIKSGENWGRVK
ncbi:MAG TPA: HNH endonuclease [Flavisolibacter sp.]|nr:HNH endonuclease [Flavisolibacter sp.]